MPLSNIVCYLVFSYLNLILRHHVYKDINSFFENACGIEPRRFMKRHHVPDPFVIVIHVYNKTHTHTQIQNLKKKFKPNQLHIHVTRVQNPSTFVYIPAHVIHRAILSNHV